jgi:hypothetical protein
MTINELKQLSKGRWDGKMKRKVVIEWRLGRLKLEKILRGLKGLLTSNLIQKNYLDMIKLCVEMPLSVLILTK